MTAVLETNHKLQKMMAFGLTLVFK